MVEKENNDEIKREEEITPEERFEISLSRLEWLISELNKEKDKLLELGSLITQFRKSHDLLDSEEFRAFLEEPYVVLPKKKDEYYVIVPRFIDFHVGWLEYETKSYRVFTINKFTQWFTPLPESLKRKIGFPEQPPVKIQDGYLATSKEHLNKIWKKYRKYLVRRVGEDKIKIKKSYEFELIVRLIEDGILPFTPQPVVKEDLRGWDGLELRDYQQDAWDEFTKKGAVGLFWPPGLGKSFFGIYCLARIKGKKLVVVPTRTLVEQWNRLIVKYIPEYINEIKIVTYHSFHKVAKEKYSLVIFDEVHHLPAPTYIRLATLKRKYSIGLSATPYREDGKESYIIALTGFPVGLAWDRFLERGMLNKPSFRVYLVKSEAEKLKKLGKLLNIPLKTLIFCDYLEMGKKIAKKFKIPFVYSETKNRLDIIRNSQVVVISRVGDEGISLPDVERVIEVAFLGGSVDYNKPIVVKQRGVVRVMRIGELVDGYYPDEESVEPVEVDDLEVLAFSPEDYKIRWVKANAVMRHPAPECLYELTLDTGRKIKLTREHSIFKVCEDRIKPYPVFDLKEGDYVIIPRRFPPQNVQAYTRIDIYRELLKLGGEVKLKVNGVITEKQFKEHEGLIRYLMYKYGYGSDDICHRKYGNIYHIPIQVLGKAPLEPIGISYHGCPYTIPRYIEVDKRFASLLGWHTAEGDLRTHHINFTLGIHEEKDASEIRRLVTEIFGLTPSYVKRPESSIIRVSINSRLIALIFDKIIKMGKNAYTRRVPEIIFNSSPDVQRSFIKSYLKGDKGASVSKLLISDILYLYLLNDILACCVFDKPQYGKGKIPYHVITSPNPYNEDVTQKNTYCNVPMYYARTLLTDVWVRGSSYYLKNYRSLNPTVVKRVLMNRTRNEYVTLLKYFKEPRTRRQVDEAIEKGMFTVWKLKMAKKEGLIENICKGLIVLSKKGREAIEKFEILEKLMNGDLAFVKVRRIEKVKPSSKYVYDISVKELENFVAGYGGVICHNSRRQEAQRFGRLLHSQKREPEHIILMTREEFERFNRRLLAIQEKGFRIEVIGG